MKPSAVIEEGKSLVQEVDYLSTQLEHAEQNIRLDLDLTDREKKGKCRERRQKILARLQAIKAGWMVTAGNLMQELAPKPEPLAPADARVRYEREHALFALSDEERESVFRSSVENGDALTFSVVCTAAPHLRLMPTHVVAQVKAAWTEKHNPHGGQDYHALHKVWGALLNLLVPLEQRVGGETAGVK